MKRRGESFAALLTLLAALAVAGFSLLLGGCSLPTDTKTVAAKGPTMVLETSKGRSEIAVEIADTLDERTKGLMFRKTMPKEAGMFFIFEEESEKSFWMKNTLIPLDMIFIDAGYKVVSIAKNAQPCKGDPCAVYPSGKPAKFVLEVNAGVSDSIGLKDGDKAQLII